ncbi:unnamed protein product [Allacma fusca]|uniref:Uncharacterized protein n=1 Tax=Allacma fusca TaxID=39272 RepID=A0A8J2KKJ4_9HEXA|nr:unnamed protein product [Allacma fusca]
MANIYSAILRWQESETRTSLSNFVWETCKFCSRSCVRKCKRYKYRSLMAGRQGISVKMFVHFYQQLRKNKFAHYDYGVTENRRRYGTKKPLLYNLKKVSVPSITIFSDGDKLAPPEDALIFWKSLGKTAQGPLVRIKETNFVHEDFCINRTARKLAYEPLVRYFSL